MDLDKSLDEVKIIAALLHDVQTLCNVDAFTTRAARLTVKLIARRVEREGIAFLTKVLPRLGKAFDVALLGETPLLASDLGLTPMEGCLFPKLLGELFSSVLTSDGMVNPTPCVTSIGYIRQILYLFYKYELPYSKEQEHEVIQSFERTEDEIKEFDDRYNQLASCIDNRIGCRRDCKDCQVNPGLSCNASWSEIGLKEPSTWCVGLDQLPLEESRLIREARRLLNELFLHFDPLDVTPAHGPGAVSTRERLWNKYRFTNVPDRVAALYPLDAFFFASGGHVCDGFDGVSRWTTVENSAKVVLVPKDSRGPRLISCEPLEHQWIQQGLGGAIVKLVESHPLTRWSVHFTNQQSNQFGALLGSKTGDYATLDLKEASDRVTVGLVRLLFPSRVLPYLEAARSLSTKLPDGRVLKLRKFAPMGSALCFPVMALVIWAILAAGTDDADARESILVYGDDVVVETARAVHAIRHLETVGLKINRQKSCTHGFFRESCGVDAYQGRNVTPLRIRKVWAPEPLPHLFEAYIAYANYCFDKRYYSLYWLLAEWLYATYKLIPSDDLPCEATSLRTVPDNWKKPRKRYNYHLQKWQYKVLTVTSRPIEHEIDGWLMLLRFFTAAGRPSTDAHGGRIQGIPHGVPSSVSDIDNMFGDAFSVRSYTERESMRIDLRWR